MFAVLRVSGCWDKDLHVRYRRVGVGYRFKTQTTTMINGSYKQVSYEPERVD